MKWRSGWASSFSSWKLLMFVLVSLMVLMSISSQGYIVGKQSTKTIEGQYSQMIAENIDSLSVNLSNYLNYIDDFARTLSNHPDLIGALEREDGGADRKQAVEGELRKFSEYYHLRLPVHIQVFSAREEVYAYPAVNAPEERNLTTAVSAFPWFGNRVALDNDFLHWNVAGDFHDPSSSNALYVSKNITRNNRSLGLLVIELNGSQIERMLNRAQIDENNPVFIFSGELTTLFHNEQLPPSFGDDAEAALDGVYRSIKARNKDEGALDVRLSGSDYRLIYKQIAATPWTMVSLIPPYLLHADSVSIWRITALTMGISVLFVALFFGILYAKVTMPVRRLSRMVRQYREGRMPEPYAYKGFREIETLSEGIFQFLGEIREQFHTIKRGEGEKRRLELQRLQEQMRPHFWHNSLNTLRFMAVLHGDPTMAEAILSLTKMLDYTLRNTDVRYSTLEEETAYAMSFVRFQEIRSMKQIRVELELDEPARQALVPKFTIQPILENAIVHGFAPAFQGEPLVRIKAQLAEGSLVIALEDNGRGIDPHRLGQLLQPRRRPSGASGGLSLSNLQQRFKLEYGELYGITVESRPNAYTRVKMTLPYQLEPQPKEGEAP
ncbi:sensor histidine kinase [Cohnella nanjingensis]|uniref:Histidine kinase n=1 Tax=Cohnella nanjingensis TaxID=1387779 RepID=A0A7X0RTE7_9BACL|nr:sensor histidine kinase [Cohnella nanjingensis]MBB6673176.1 histidine kinase [Cohnella nanjingensis]